MSVADLSISPRTRGRAPRSVAVDFVRELGQADLALLASERGVKAPELKRLRDRHHALARCLATGMSPAEASAVTGYDVSRISILRADPTFKELMAHYAEMKETAFADFQERAAIASIVALDLVVERMEDTPDDISTNQALEIVKTLADRTGHSPVQRVQNTNVNIDLGGRLAAARQRMQAARSDPSVIEGEVVAPRSISPPDAGS